MAVHVGVGGAPSPIWRLSVARIIDAPLGLPTGIVLKVLHDSRMIPDVESFLRCFAPQATVSGEVDGATSFELAAGEALLICSANWPQLVERFDAELGPNRVLVLLGPEDYAWGHAAFARSLPSWPNRTGSQPVSQHEGRAHFSKWAKLVVNDDGSVGRVDPDTLWLFQDRASRNAAALAEVKQHLADRESLVTLETLLTGSVTDLFRRYSDRVFRHVQYMAR